MRNIIFVILCFSSLILQAQQEVEVNQFFCSDCEQLGIDESFVFNIRIVDSSRIGDNYKITVAVRANCAVGSYYGAEILNDTLILKYGIAEGYAGVFCACTFNFEYQLSNVPRKQFTVKIRDTYQSFFGERIIHLSPHKFTSENYPMNLSQSEYQTLFLEKIDKEREYTDRLIEIMRELVLYLENGGCDEELISEKTEEYQLIRKETFQNIRKSVDVFIKDVLGEAFVNEKETELENFFEGRMDEYGALWDKLDFFGING